MLRKILTFLLPIALAACANAPQVNAPVAVSPVLKATQYGLIEGVDDTGHSGTFYWLGVPFAKPPVGALRWKAPVDPDPWTLTQSTKAFGNACVQNGALYGPGANNTYDTTIASTMNQAVGSEDCLYLNVWRPATQEANLPVIVFIHGGSWIMGYTADPMYNGANLARIANAVVITVNYRLGVFGWFNLAQLKTGNANDDSGNFGTLDNVKALQWVNRNIGEFGGNAGNVTVMGQSAGAANTWALLVAAQTRSAGLFHRIAAISGGMSLSSDLPAGAIPWEQPASYSAAQGNALLNNLLIADGKASDQASASAFVATQTSAQIADYLRAKSPSTILATLYTKLFPLGLASSFPVPDGTVLPMDPIASVAAGNYAKVPVLASNTRDEGRTLSWYLTLSPALGGVPGFKVTPAELFMTQYSFDPNGQTTLTAESLIDPKYLPLDAPETGFKAKTALLTNAQFITTRDKLLDTLKTQQSNIWYYQFNWAQEPPPWNDLYGAGQVLDVPFLFGNFGPSLHANVIGGNANKGGRIALSNAMMESIASFARTGDPNDASLGVTWPVWPKALVFNASLTDKAISVTLASSASSPQESASAIGAVATVNAERANVKVGESSPQEFASTIGAVPTVKAERPKVKVGERWKFACETGAQKSELVWVVTSVDQTGIKGTENGQPLVLSPEMNQVESPRRKDSNWRRLSFPLEVGKRWNATNEWTAYDTASGTSSGTATQSFVVVGYEKVRVHAGEFDAFRLQEKAFWQDNFGNPGTTDMTYWYAPAAKTVVKYDFFATHNPESTCELVEFQLQP
ncbi:Carboxylesterase type B (modular protein) [Burkholderiales bacterium]|jgi:para-nitrobenzyl esterase|nr:Carboxylesterase type B (modular protein) [Burkholderiales bacterium]